MVSLAAADAALQSPDAFLKLGNALDDLVQSQHLYDQDAAALEDSKRVQISRTYLWLLGYLRRDSGRETIDADYRAGVGRLRTDLGMEPQDKLDDAAWQALRQLAQFDADIDVNQWLGRSRRQAAFGRAIRLRLFACGLTDTPPTLDTREQRKTRRQEQDLSDALADFARLAALLGLATEPLEPTLNPRLTALLFDHIGMIRRLPLGERGFLVVGTHPDLPLAKTARGKLIKQFASHLALVELWLLGYSVRPGKFRVDGPGGADNKMSLNEALARFARDRDIRFDRRQQITVGPWFFMEARRILDADPDQSIADVELDRVISNSKQFRSLRKNYEGLGARIIDGIRRALVAVVDFFRRLFHCVKRILRNLARSLHYHALNAYRGLRASFEVVALGYEYFSTSPVGGSDLSGVYMAKQADFDLTVTIASNATQGQVQEFFTALDLRVRAMRLGGAILDQLWRLVRLVMSLSRAALGWLGLIIVLVRFAKWLRGATALARESRTLVTAFDTGVVTA